MMSFDLRALIGIVVAANLSACANGGANAQGQISAGPDAQAIADGGSTADASYKLGSGDKLRVITFNETSLTGEFVVSNTGEISMPLIGRVKVAGLTLSEAELAIQRPLSDGYLKDPHVSVEVVNFRPFYILGEVNKPGEYPYSTGLTVVNAVATANGFTYRANTHVVLIKHIGETAEHQVDLNASLQVRPGDTVRVKERYF